MATPSPFLYPILILTISFLCQASAIQNGARYLGNFWSSSKTLSLAAKTGAPKYQYETKYFQQKLDHFSFADLPSFPQRYLLNTQHWVGPSRLGPIFLYCGNEGDIEWFAANTGFVWEIAPLFGAMVIFPEHRYYGESMPYGSKEEAYKNATTLSYLTAEQALADYAVLVTELKRNLSAQACPVVLFGGSYGGMLAAWMRLKYPHISIGALASSAPVLQFEDLVPPETFYNIVSNDFRHESTSCFNTIKESWDVINKVGRINGGLAQLTKTFHICRELESVDGLSDWLESAYSYLAMANYPYPTDFLMPLPEAPIKEVCRKIDSLPDVDCFDLDHDPHGMSGWDWQACTGDDYASWQVTTGLIRAQSDRFTFLKIPGVVAVLLEDVSETIVALTTEKGAHHLDLRAATAEDPDWLLDQRSSEIKLIRDWLDEYYDEKKATFSTFKNPLTDEVIWKRLREAGFDEDPLNADKAALIAYIAKLEAELYDHQYQMGLLILERKEWVSKNEQFKAASVS
ncbi:hypothetical protein HAX54_011340 [Datura stramonium]|uniref:Lysosomal Pro-X carboxypeptidase n=1 Tax=Datura stramonium TaxID=4076 RepID=A0ABS8TJE0_DATST|nr:hypothetical protein [Datura stramonium]